jgi:predicted nucleotidyltransferase
MAKKAKLGRDTIVKALVKALEPLDFAYAFWEGGAAAWNRIDDLSDIDLYLVVNDDKADEAFLATEKALKSLSPIKQKYDVPQTMWPGVSQAFYKLENANNYLIIDFAVLKLSGKEKFLEPEIHGNNVFYFHKKNRIKPPPLDKAAFVSKLFQRLERLQARFNMFNVFIQKEIKRGNYIEAVDLYHNLTIQLLVEALRIKHNPVHYEFKMRYVHYELPSETVEKLELLNN